MLPNLGEYSSLLVLMVMHLSHLLEDSRIGGGECLKGMHKGAKLRSRDGDGKLRCSRCDWWNRRIHRESSRSSLSVGTGGAASAKGSPYSCYGGTGGATMGGALGGPE